MEQVTLTLVDSVEGIGHAGERVTLALQPADVHDPSELPTYLAGFRPFEFRGDEASPVALVDRDEDKFRNFSSDDAFEDVVVKGSTQGPPPEVDPRSSLDSYKVVERYLGAFIPRQTQDNASNPNYDPTMAAGRRVRWGLELDREIDAWALLGTDTNWDPAVRTAVGGGSEWDVGGDPIADLHAAIEKSFQVVTEIWMNTKVGNAFLRNPAVRDHMRQMLGDSAVTGATTQVAGAGTRQSPRVDFQIPGLPPIKIAGAKRKLAAGGLGYILPDVAVLTTTVPGDFPTSGEEIQSSTTFRRRGPSGVGMEVREFFVDARGPLGGTMVVVSMADIALMTANTAGGIITNVHS